MRVFITPFFEGNQFLELLESNLQNRGISVEHSSSARPLAFPLIGAIRSDSDVFHLHWTHPYFLFGKYKWIYRLPFIYCICWFFALVFVSQVVLASRFCDRVVWTIHNRCNHENRYEEMDRWVSRHVFSVADSVQVWDENTEREIATYLDVETSKMVRIPHGSYLPLYPAEDQLSKTSAREALRINSEERVCLYFGIIRPYKQVPRLIDVWDELNPDEAKLVIAGNPKCNNLAAAIEAKAANRDDVITDLRHIPDAEVSRYFAACDHVICPYRDILSSGTVVLAMSMGRAFVAPDMGAISSLDPGGNVVYNSLRNGIVTALSSSRSAAERTGQHNLEYAKTKLVWENIVERLMDVYGALSA